MPPRAATQASPDCADGHVEIVMHEGSVLVRGPPAPEGIVLRAGQRPLIEEPKLARRERASRKASKRGRS